MCGSFQYDNVGNLLSWDQYGGNGGSSPSHINATYDFRNRITSAERRLNGQVVGSANYQYDALGRRIGGSVDLDGARSSRTTQTWMVYDGEDALSDFNGSGIETKRYLVGPGSDNLVARLDANGEKLAWYLTDRLGSVRNVVDGSGASQYHSNYTLLGNSEATTGTGGDRFGFTSREFEPAIGLQFNRARAYDPTWGRWTSEDPIGFAGGDHNLYRYVGNAATNYTDPSGLILSDIIAFNDPPTSNQEIANFRRKVTDQVGENRATGLTNEEFASTDWKPEHLLAWYALYKGSTALARIEAMGSQKVSIDFNPHEPTLFGLVNNDIFETPFWHYDSYYEANFGGGGVIHISAHHNPHTWVLGNSLNGKKRTLLSALNVLDFELDRLLCEDNLGASFFSKLDLSGKQLRDWMGMFKDSKHGELENLQKIYKNHRIDVIFMGNAMAVGADAQGKKAAITILLMVGSYAAATLVSEVRVAAGTVDDLANVTKKSFFTKLQDALNAYKTKGNPIESTSSVPIPPGITGVSKNYGGGAKGLTYEWTDNGFTYTARLHEATSGAPAGSPISWVVQRSKKGQAGSKKHGIQQIESILETLAPNSKGGVQWLSKDEWAKLIKGNEAKTLTVPEKELLSGAHWDIPHP